MRGRALAWALSQPWAVTPEALEVGLDIAAREHEGPEAVEARTGKPLENARRVTYRETPAGRVAVVPITGPIFRRADVFSRISGATTLDSLATDFTAALDDPEVSSIVLDIDSPGGQATGIGEFAQMVRAAKKPVVAYVDGAAASAAYWIASAAKSIVGSPSSLHGSIGVVWATRKEGTDEKKGIYQFTSSAAPLKRPDPASEKGRAAIQGVVDDLHAIFEGDVAKYRGVSREAVRSDFGRGGVMVAAKAVKAGMIDAVGSFEGVIADLGAGRVPGRTNKKQGGAAMASWRENVLKVLFGGDGEASDDAPPLTADEKGHLRVAAAAPLRPFDATAGTADGGGLTAAEREELRQLRADRERADAEREKGQLAALGAEALAFADGLIAAHKAFPADRAAIAQQYASVALADRGLKAQVVRSGEGAQATIAVVPGPADRTASLLDSFKTSCESRQPHRMTEDIIPAATVAPQKPKADEGLAKLDAAADEWATRNVKKS